MEHEILEDIILHLESVRGDYHGVIAASALGGGERPGEQDALYRGAERPRLLFLSVAEPPMERNADQELLEAAIGKGLQRGMEEIGVLELPAAEAGAGERLRRELQRRGPEILAVLGVRAWRPLSPWLGEPAHHELFVRAGVTCLLSHSLAEMRADVQKKKDFWFNLKTIMVALKWNPR